MGITDELRKWGYGFCGDTHDVVTAIADRIDAEYQKAIRELNNLADASVLLPVDDDGEVIHIGDVMERGEARGCVIALMLSKYPKKCGGALHWGIQLEGEHAPTAFDGLFHHHHPDTWERIIEDATALGAQMGRRTTQVDDLVARCKALADDRKGQ